MDYESLQGQLIKNDINFEKNQTTNLKEESCVSGLNETGKKTAFFLCFLIGFLIQLISFDSTVDDFMIWFMLGSILNIVGIGFITNFAIQLERIHKRKRKEFLAGILVCFCIIMLLKGFDKGEDFFIFLIYLIQELAFFQYARTYVDDFDNFARRLVGDLGYYE